MKFFVECGLNPTYKDKIQQTPLYYASREGKYQCCKYLIESGCTVNDLDYYNQTPIFYAARYFYTCYVSEKADCLLLNCY